MLNGIFVQVGGNDLEGPTLQLPGKLLDLHVGGIAQNGPEVLTKIASLKPDVVTLDVQMPGMDGIETLKRIMREAPCPVIMVSSETQAGAEVSLEALANGAFDCIAKHESNIALDLVKIRTELITKIKAAAENGRRQHRPQPVAPPAKIERPKRSSQGPVSVIALGTSTGGPKALQEILPMLPEDLSVGVLIVQHMPKGFTEPFAKRLDHMCKVAVREASHDEPILPGVVYIAPAGQHMTTVRRSPTRVDIRLSHNPEGTAHTPSVDVMMLSVAEVYRGTAMGVIMTGMGADGVRGMQAIARQGGLTVGQDEATCSVYGMPRSCAESGVLQRVVPLMQIPDQIVQATGHRKSS